jgi:hypothetical protein
MALQRFPAFVGPSYQLQSVRADCQRAVNIYVEMNALGTGKDGEVAILAATPGLRLKVTLPESPVRGIWYTSTGELYAVGGTKLYSISSAWVATEIGSLSTSSGYVSIADNGTHVFIVDGTFGYHWNMDTDVFTTMSDPAFYAATHVTFQDGYFLFNRAGTKQFFISGLTDVTFDALDIASAEGSPDPIVALISASQTVYLFGTQSIEPFYNSGNGDFPFERVQGAVIGFGTSAPYSVAELGGEVYWLGGDRHGQGIIYKMQGYQPQRISTPAIEAVIRALNQEELAQARAWVYQQGGHLFYCLNLPGAEATWCFDASTGLWHERQFRNKWSLERHRADCHAVAFGLNIVGDYENGKIYQLDPDYRYDDTTPMVYKRVAPHFSRNGRNVRHNRFELDMEMGVGIDGSGQGSDPKVMMRYSDDGGNSWSNELQASIGKIGETKKRAAWNRLGSSRGRVYEVAVSDPVRQLAFLGARIDSDEGYS